MRKDISLSQQVVQASHAAIAAGQILIPSSIEHPHLVVIGVNGESDLYKVLARLEQADIRFCAFTEADLNNELTALCTEPVSGERRRFFRRYRCLEVPP